MNTSNQLKQKRNTTHTRQYYNMALLAALLTTSAPSLSHEKPPYEESLWVSTSTNITAKKDQIAEYMNFEIIFKTGIRNALRGLNDINQIPQWGKYIDYYWDDGKLKGQKLKPEYIKLMWLPDRFDIMPRSIDEPIKCMTFCLGNRRFTIEPIAGKIQKVVLNTTALVIITTLIDLEYDKEEKLPDLFFRLWNTSVWKWIKPWFKWSIVTEI